jgi:hypothetical protein
MNDDTYNNKNNNNDNEDEDEVDESLLGGDKGDYLAAPDFASDFQANNDEDTRTEDMKSFSEDSIRLLRASQNPQATIAPPGTHIKDFKRQKEENIKGADKAIHKYFQSDQAEGTRHSHRDHRTIDEETDEDVDDDDDDENLENDDEFEGGYSVKGDDRYDDSREGGGYGYDVDDDDDDDDTEEKKHRHDSGRDDDDRRHRRKHDRDKRHRKDKHTTRHHHRDDQHTDKSSDKSHRKSKRRSRRRSHSSHTSETDDQPSSLDSFRFEEKSDDQDRRSDRRHGNEKQHSAFDRDDISTGQRYSENTTTIQCEKLQIIQTIKNDPELVECLGERNVQKMDTNWPYPVLKELLAKSREYVHQNKDLPRYRQGGKWVLGSGVEKLAVEGLGVRRFLGWHNNLSEQIDNGRYDHELKHFGHKIQSFSNNHPHWYTMLLLAGTMVAHVSQNSNPKDPNEQTEEDKTNTQQVPEVNLGGGGTSKPPNAANDVNEASDLGMDNHPPMPPAMAPPPPQQQQQQQQQQVPPPQQPQPQTQPQPQPQPQPPSYRNDSSNPPAPKESPGLTREELQEILSQSMSQMQDRLEQNMDKKFGEKKQEIDQFHQRMVEIVNKTHKNDESWRRDMSNNIAKLNSIIATYESGDRRPAGHGRPTDDYATTDQQSESSTSSTQSSRGKSFRDYPSAASSSSSWWNHQTQAGSSPMVNGKSTSRDLGSADVSADHVSTATNGHTFDLDMQDNANGIARDDTFPQNTEPHVTSFDVGGDQYESQQVPPPQPQQQQQQEQSRRQAESLPPPPVPTTNNDDGFARNATASNTTTTATTTSTTVPQTQSRSEQRPQEAFGQPSTQTEQPVSLSWDMQNAIGGSTHGSRSSGSYSKSRKSKNHSKRNGANTRFSGEIEYV